ncbi:hypothetical protein [Ruegeria jejuensis]|uniref:hypothetical protein n=1 Tax=Ruegeria jejuensis TaxID=3233338 RepID=UPI00355B5112
MSFYQVNRSWSDQFLPEIRRIVGGHLLKAAPDPLDHFQATDLVTLDAKDMRIAARVRRPGYSMLYPNQFTIRAQVPSGAETELSKIVNGYGDWMFYGHAGVDGLSLQNWWLIDLRAFRAALIRHGANGSFIRMGDKRNPDGTCFKWFDIQSFPDDPPLVVARG